MTLAQRFQQKRQTIMADPTLSEHGKQQKLKALFEEFQLEYQRERALLDGADQVTRARQAEVAKRKPPVGKLPALPFKAEYASDGEKTQLNLLAQLGGVLAEARTAKRLISAVAAAATPDAARQALERAMMVEPFAGPALIGAYSEMLTAAESKFAPRQARSQDGEPAMDSGDLIGLGQFRMYLDAQYKAAVEADTTAEQRKFAEENAATLGEINSAVIESVQKSILLDSGWNDIQSEMVGPRLSAYAAVNED